jgi:glycerophosphoryl diester phosphodiesterase
VTRRPAWPFEPFEAIAHRGGAWEAPENSRMAFQHAVDLGFTFIETDVRATADGVCVVFHDAWLDRTTDGRGLVRESSWNSVAQARIHGRQPVMSFEQLLEAFPATRFNIDVKEPNAIEPFVAVMRRTGAWRRVVAGSFSHERLTAVRRRGGHRLATSMSPREVLRLWLAARNRGRRWQPPPAACVQIPPMFGRRVVLEPRLLDLAHALGWPVHAWTIDTAGEMDRLIELGVDGIMTDRPTLLRAVLQQRGMWGGR